MKLKDLLELISDGYPFYKGFIIEVHEVLTNYKCILEYTKKEDIDKRYLNYKVSKYEDISSVVKLKITDLFGWSDL